MKRVEGVRNLNKKRNFSKGKGYQQEHGFKTTGKEREVVGAKIN